MASARRAHLCGLRERFDGRGWDVDTNFQLATGNVTFSTDRFRMAGQCHGITAQRLWINRGWGFDNPIYGRRGPSTKRSSTRSSKSEAEESPLCQAEGATRAGGPGQAGRRTSRTQPVTPLWPARSRQAAGTSKAIPARSARLASETTSSSQPTATRPARRTAARTTRPSGSTPTTPSPSCGPTARQSSMCSARSRRCARPARAARRSTSRPT